MTIPLPCLRARRLSRWLKSISSPAKNSWLKPPTSRNAAASMIEDDIGLPRGSMQVIPNAVPVIDLEPPPRRDAVLTVGAVGISAYRQAGLALAYPAKDARDVADLFRAQRERLYANVKTRTLVDAEATRANILGALREVRDQSSPWDVTLFFLSGHGVANPGAGSYCFLPFDADPGNPATLVDGQDLRDLRLDTYRRQIGIVYQESFLFSNTVAANLAFGHPHATMEQSERAARSAAAHEFIIALPETDANGAQTFAERIRKAMANKVILFEGKEIRITASFGVTGFDASTPAEQISAEGLIRLADQCLYRAKEEGRNRIVTGRI